MIVKSSLIEPNSSCLHVFSVAAGLIHSLSPRSVEGRGRKGFQRGNLS